MRGGTKLLMVTRGRQNGSEPRNNDRMRDDMTMGGYGMESNQGGQMRMEDYGNMEMASRGRQYQSGQSNSEGYSDYTPNSYTRTNDPHADMVGRFRDRRGREHYDDGRFAPMKSEMESGRWLPPYYDIDVNRYEYELEGNSRGGEGDRGSGNRMTRNDPSSRKSGGNMRMNGFGRELYNDMHSDASVPKIKEMDHLPGKQMKGGAKSSMGMDEHMAKEWTANMENEDGTKGPHWNMEQIKKVMEQRNMTGDPVEFWVAMNMMYSDYCKVAKKLGVNSVDFYAEMAKAFLEDKDTGVPDKLTAYYENVVKG